MITIGLNTSSPRFGDTSSPGGAHPRFAAQRSFHRVDFRVQSLEDRHRAQRMPEPAPLRRDEQRQYQRRERNRPQRAPPSDSHDQTQAQYADERSHLRARGNRTRQAERARPEMTRGKLAGGPRPVEEAQRHAERHHVMLRHRLAVQRPEVRPMPSPTLTARATPVETNRVRVRNTRTTASAVSVDAVSLAMRFGPRGASRFAPTSRSPVAVTAPKNEPTGEYVDR